MTLHRFWKWGTDKLGGGYYGEGGRSRYTQAVPRGLNAQTAKPSASRTPPHQDEKTPQLINGRPPGSSLELTVALALDQLRLTYRYQVPILGGRQLRGGQVIDFIVNTVPLPTPLFAQGTYWHGGAKKLIDQYKLRQVQAAFDYQVNPPVEIWEDQAQNVDQAASTLRALLML